jgi:poly-gamma-glutamate capsule biosynthesis protein CapA/YwtB (metallophosphatase superfamily)
MPQIKPEVEAFARIKVIGVGGSGKNAVNHMINSKVRGVDFIAINTDAQDLHHSLPKKKIHIGKNLTRGLGTGMNPELGKRAAEETKEEIQEAVKGADALLVVTEWSEFRVPDFEEIKTSLVNPIVFDGRNIFSIQRMADLGFEYYCIGVKS